MADVSLFLRVSIASLKGPPLLSAKKAQDPD